MMEEDDDGTSPTALAIEPDVQLPAKGGGSYISVVNDNIGSLACAELMDEEVDCEIDFRNIQARIHQRITDHGQSSPNSKRPPISQKTIEMLPINSLSVDDTDEDDSSEQNEEEQNPSLTVANAESEISAAKLTNVKKGEGRGRIKNLLNSMRGGDQSHIELCTVDCSTYLLYPPSKPLLELWYEELRQATLRVETISKRKSGAEELMMNRRLSLLPKTHKLKLTVNKVIIHNQSSAIMDLMMKAAERTRLFQSKKTVQKERTQKKDVIIEMAQVYSGVKDPAIGKQRENPMLTNSSDDLQDIISSIPDIHDEVVEEAVCDTQKADSKGPLLDKTFPLIELVVHPITTVG